MHDYCHVCGRSLSPVEVDDCPRCADVEKRLTPEVLEWIRDVVATAVDQHVEKYKHEFRDYDD